MIHYKDMTFCSSDCTNKDCFRYFSEGVKQGAIAWCPENPVVALSDFSLGCKYYLPSR